MSWRAFLSYSRQQYHFAESLALTLQNKGVALWFDVQQLEPGSDWKADIEDGLTRSDTVLLLASKAALASPYVEREWRHALERRKVVIVGVIESVRIPPDLRAMPILDLRGDFARATDQLVAQLRQPTPPRPVATWRTQLAPGVNRMARALLVRDVQRVLGALLLALIALSLFIYSSLLRLVIDGTPVVINQAMEEWGRPNRFEPDLSPIASWVFVGVVVALLLNLVRIVTRLETLPFVARKFDYNTLSAPPARLSPDLIILLWALLVAGHLDFMRAFFDPRGVPPIDLGLLVFTGVGIVLMVILLWTSKRLAPRHPDPDIVRFAELGKVPTQWRAHVNGAVAGATYAPQRAAQGGLTMHLYAEAGDEEVVNALRPLVEQMGGQFVVDSAPARYDLLILSHASRLERARAALGGNEGVLGILASRCTISDELRQLRNFQLVDFSRRDADSLLAALGLLTAASDADRMRMQSYRDPVSLNRVAAPGVVAMLANGLLALALLCGVVIGLLWLSGVSGNALLIDAAALGACAVVLLIAALAALRGRSLLPRPLLLALAFAPPVVIALSAFVLPAQTTLFGTTLPLIPQGVLALLLAAGLVTGGFVLTLTRSPHALVPLGRAVFGMPMLAINPLAALGWVMGALAVAGVMMSGG